MSSSLFTEAIAFAFSRLRALMGTFTVVGLSDGAVLIAEEGGMVFGIVVLPELGGVVLVFTGGGM